jgi:hypothetical protein
MENDTDSEIKKMFRSFIKAAQEEKCTNALFQINKGLKPSPCEFSKAGQTVFCLKHGAVKV